MLPPPLPHEKLPIASGESQRGKETEGEEEKKKKEEMRGAATKSA